MTPRSSLYSLRRRFFPVPATLAALLLAACGGGSGDSAPGPAPEPPPNAALPNILFIVMDDLGVDQLSVFGYGGVLAAHTPNLDAIAKAGVRFRNTWSMPTCSPTRATFFSGRYPLRTNVQNAVLSLDLANSQFSPFELSTPKLLKQKGYVNGLVGKMHLSGSDLNPAYNPLGHEVMRELGWDYFEGYLDGAPYPLDTTAGGVSRDIDENGAGVYACGFVPNTQDDPQYGADSGACYTLAGDCTGLSLADAPTPGRLCLERGGIFDPGQACKRYPPSYVNFNIQNGYYTAEWVINHEDGTTEFVPASDPQGRGYRSTLETDRAVAWLKRQPAGQPWMLSVGYSAIHTPLQQPPTSLLREDAIETGGFDCKDTQQQRVLTNQMLEALDKEIGRLLVEAGLASRSTDGTLDYRPQDTDTMVIIVGDNGTYAPSVKAPFNPLRSKGSAYQTGIWVPLIVAGPLVNEPDRDVEHMVNTTDLFSLFGELAGLDVHAQMPAGRIVDAQPVMPYLDNAEQASIRSTNYTEMGANLTATTAEAAPPCVLAALDVCVQVFPQQGVCEDQGGTWYGAGGASGGTGLSSCCAVNDYLQSQGQEPVRLLPTSARAIRNEHFKLVRLARPNCAGPNPEVTDELYWINQAAPIPVIDNESANLLDNAILTAEQRQNYDALSDELEQLIATQAECPGDGNLDNVVDEGDVRNWEHYSTLNDGRSSWYDFNLDGLTNDADLTIIQQNMGKHCQPAVS